MHALITQLIKGAYIAGNYNTVPPEVREALDMIAHKIGRILAGNPMYKDHWDDIAGYATLVSKFVDKNEKALEPIGPAYVDDAVFYVPPMYYPPYPPTSIEGGNLNTTWGVTCRNS
jgi:hypothetical protein